MSSERGPLTAKGLAPGLGQAEAQQTFENLWTAWHCLTRAGPEPEPEPRPGAGLCMRLGGESATE